MNMTKAASDVLAERERQRGDEGWTEAHDAEHQFGELAAAGAAYALHAADLSASHGLGSKDGPPVIWPWDESSWKPKGKRRDLVRATALMLAEIERLDRVDGTA